MRTWRALFGTEQGAAIVLAVTILLVLLLAFLSASALEPQISRNVADAARARYLAEAGIEIGFNMLVNTGNATQSFTPALSGATSSAPWVALVTNGTLPGVTTGGAAGEATFAGSYTVVIRNDYQIGDAHLTGQSAGASAMPNETPTSDTNKIVIMRSTGTFRGVTKTIEVVVRRAPLPSDPDSVNLPRRQTADQRSLDEIGSAQTDGPSVPRGPFHPRERLIDRLGPVACSPPACPGP